MRNLRGLLVGLLCVGMMPFGVGSLFSNNIGPSGPVDPPSTVSSVKTEKVWYHGGYRGYYTPYYSYSYPYGYGYGYYPHGYGYGTHFFGPRVVVGVG